MTPTLDFLRHDLSELSRMVDEAKPTPGAFAGLGLRLRKMADDFCGVLGGVAVEPVVRDTERFSRLADEPRAVIPDGYTAPLDTRTTHELIHDRTRARDGAEGAGGLPLAVRLRDEEGPPLPQMIAQRRAQLSAATPRDWVNCPICDEPDMLCETFDEGATLIHCANHGCPSNKRSIPAAVRAHATPRPPASAAMGHRAGVDTAAPSKHAPDAMRLLAELIALSPPGSFRTTPNWREREKLMDQLRASASVPPADGAERRWLIRVAVIYSRALDKVPQDQFIDQLRALEAALNPFNYRPSGAGAVEPVAPEKYIPDIVKNAMLTMWNEICADTDCHPLDITHGTGKMLWFTPHHWAELTGNMVAQNIAGLYASPPVRGVREIQFGYRNWRGENSHRRARPISIRYGVSEYHKRDGWLMLALDLDKNEQREFSMRDMILVEPADSLPVQPGAGERDRRRCPRCLGHGIVPVLPGASLSVKAPDSDGDCSLCSGSGFVS